MKRLLWILLLASAWAQTPQLPSPVNDLEWYPNYINPSFTINFPASGTGGTWAGGGPYTAASQSSLCQAIADAETYRTGHLSSSFLILIPPANYSGANGCPLPQTVNDTSTQFIILAMTTTPNWGYTACSHGTTLNVPMPTIPVPAQRPAIRNPGCNGSALSYQLATSVYFVNPVTVNTSIDDSLTNWGVCVLPGCNPGGTGTPSADSQTINNATPSLDGASMAVSVTGPVLAAGQTTDALWYYKPGANNNSTIFSSTYHMYIASTSNVEALEFDQFQFVSGVEYMFGSQCVIGGVWDIWNQLSGVWVATSIPCSLSTSAWHTIIWNGHRVPGDTSCSSNACMYYDSLSIDGTVYNGFTPQPSGSTAFADNTGTQVQIDVNSTGGAATMFLDEVNFSQQTGPFTLANGTATTTLAYNDIANMWTLECTAANCNALSTATWDANNVGPHHYVILGAELRPQAGLVSVNAPFLVGQGTETITSQIPQHIFIAYSYLHGDWVDPTMTGCPSSCAVTAGPTGANSLPFLYSGQACIYCGVAYSYFDKNLRPGSEGHGLGLLMVQQFKFVHNVVEGASIPKICGGAGASISFTNFITCQNEQDGDNMYTYPWSWMLAWASSLQPNGGTSGYVSKNRNEHKFGEYVLEYGNIYMNQDGSGGQNGTIFSLKTAQNSGGGTGTNYWTTLDNVTFKDLLWFNSCNGPSFGDRSSGVGNGGGVAFGPKLMSLSNLLGFNVSTNLPGCAVTGFTTTPQYSIRNGQAPPGTTWAATAVRDSSGLTSTLTLTSAAGQTVSDQNIGDPVTVTGCSDSTFNVGNTVMGPPALTGTLVNGLTIVYSNSGTANATATGCTFSNAQGNQKNISVSHATVIADTGHFGPYDSALAGTNPFALALNNSYVNSIFVNGGLSSSAGEGTAVSTRDYDPATFCMNNDFIGGRTPASYTEYCGAHAGVSPPVTIYFQPNACSTSSPSGCLGILAGMSTSTFPIIPPAVGGFVAGDYHSYRLCQSTDVACSSTPSTYAAGQSGQASDGTDLGANIAAIDASETLTQYPGMFPDVPGAPICLGSCAFLYSQNRMLAPGGAVP